jgi:Cdc6-like AAA superfamily ATPase
MTNILPVQLTSLIGREQEIETLCQLLHRPDIRLVTITGLDGVGKTSLALQVAHELSDAFHEGVFFISLAPIYDPTLIIPTIARLLDVTESPNRLMLDSLKDFLRDKQMLLLLDNFEQIVAAGALVVLNELVDFFCLGYIILPKGTINCIVIFFRTGKHDCLQ